MVRYLWDPNLSDEKYLTAPQPTQADIAPMAFALGIMARMEVPLLECLVSTASVTPNMRLRWTLKQIFDRARDLGNDQTFPEFIPIYEDVIGEELVQVLIEEAQHDWPGTYLVEYAEQKHPTPNGLLTEYIVRSGCVTAMFICVHNALSQEESFLAGAHAAIPYVDHRFKKIINAICTDVESGCWVAEALARREDIFDDVCVNVIKGGERQNRLQEAFELLCHP